MFGLALLGLALSGYGTYSADQQRRKADNEREKQEELRNKELNLQQREAEKLDAQIKAEDDSTDERVARLEGTGFNTVGLDPVLK